MHVTDTIHALPISRQFGPVERTFHLTLLLDERHGPTLVDTGLPGSEDAIAAALEPTGVRLGDLRRLILTHHDLDHAGSAAAVVRASGATVLAHPEEVAYLDGSRPALKHPPAEQLAALPAPARALLERGAEPVRVDLAVHDGERLDVSGLRVVFTPGHSPGHISLYSEREQVLIAGDALTVVRGELRGPPPAQTPDMPRALQSVAALSRLDARVLIAHHGGILHDLRPQLERLLAVVGGPGGS